MMTGGAAVSVREVEREEVQLMLSRVGWPKRGGGKKGVARERGLAMAQAEREGEGKVGHGAGQKREGGRTSLRTLFQFRIAFLFSQKIKLGIWMGFGLDFKVNLKCGGWGKSRKVKGNIWWRSKWERSRENYLMPK
jgi:hypothetical protein